MKTKLDAESFGQAISMIVQIWAVFKEVMIQAGIGLEFVVWVLGEGKKKFKESILALGEEYRKTLPLEPEVEHVVDFNSTPKIPAGLRVADEKDQIRSRITGKRNLRDINVLLHLDVSQKGGKWSRGYDLKPKLEGQEVYGAQLLDFYLEHRDLIPEDWKAKGAIFFWGTIYCGDVGHLYVRCFLWVGTGWILDYRRLGDDWSDDDPAAVSASKN